MYAYRLSQVDKQEEMHWQAWINHVVTSTDDKGKTKFKEFKEFFNYDKSLKEVMHKTNKTKVNKDLKRLAVIAKKANERR